MDNLNTEIKSKILEYLKTTRIGASSVEIAKNIGHNRITVSKYLEIMKAHRLIDYEGVAQAKLWHISSRDSRPCVLIVDDEPHVVDLVALSLIPEKFTILKAYSGLDALDKVYKETPDLVILDLMMPGMNGYEVCQKLKENALTQHIPIIILSAKGQLDDRLRGLKIGADDYITKPFDPMELEARVERLIRRSSQGLDMHPLTRLPGRAGLRDRLRQLTVQKADFRVHNFTIRNLDQFNKKCGYRRGEHLLTMVARIFAELLKDRPDAYVGHTYRDSFVLISRTDSIVSEVKKRFEQALPYICPGRSSLSLEVSRITSREIQGKHLKIDDVFNSLGVK